MRGQYRRISPAWLSGSNRELTLVRRIQRFRLWSLLSFAGFKGSGYGP